MSSLLPVGSSSSSSSVYSQTDQKPVLTLFQQIMRLARERIKMLQPESDESSLQRVYDDFEREVRKDITAVGFNPDSIEGQDSYIRQSFQNMGLDPEAPNAMQDYLDKKIRFLLIPDESSTEVDQMKEELASLIAELSINNTSDINNTPDIDVDQLREKLSSLIERLRNTPDIASGQHDFVDLQQILKMVEDLKKPEQDALDDGQNFSSDMDLGEKVMFQMLNMLGINPIEMMQKMFNPDSQNIAEELLKNFREAKERRELDKLLQVSKMSYEASGRQYALGSLQGVPPQIVLNLRKCELEAFKIIKGSLEAKEWEEFQTACSVQEIKAQDDKLLHKLIRISLETLPDFVHMARFDMPITSEACLAHLYENRENVQYQLLMRKPDFAESIKHLVLARQSKTNEETQKANDSLNVISLADIHLWLAGFLNDTDRMTSGAYWDARLKSVPLSSANVIPLALLAARHQLEGLQKACQDFLASSSKGESEVITITHLIFKEVEVCQKLLRQLVMNNSAVKWLILTPDVPTTVSKFNIVVPGFKKLKDLKTITQKGISHPIVQGNVEGFLRVFLNRSWQDLTTVGFNCWIDEQTGEIHYEGDKPQHKSGGWQKIYVNFKVNAGKWEISIGKPQDTPVWDDAYQQSRQAVLTPFKAAINRLIQKTGGHSDCKEFSDIFTRLRALNQSIVLKKSDKASKEEMTELDLGAILDAALEELNL